MGHQRIQIILLLIFCCIAPNVLAATAWKCDQQIIPIAKRCNWRVDCALADDEDASDCDNFVLANHPPSAEYICEFVLISDEGFCAGKTCPLNDAPSDLDCAPFNQTLRNEAEQKLAD